MDKITLEGTREEMETIYNILVDWLQAAQDNNELNDEEEAALTVGDRMAGRLFATLHPAKAQYAVYSEAADQGNDDRR